MKKMGLFLAIGLVSVLFVSGCASTNSGNLQLPKDNVSYLGKGIPIINPPPGPVEMATGAAIITRANSESESNRALANLLNARAERIRKRDTADVDASAEPVVLLGVVINDSLDKRLNFDHPALKKIYDVSVGGHQFFPVDKIPENINYWFAGSKKKKSFRIKPKKEPQEYDGVPVAFIIRIKR